jgi:hypothetical protein
MNRWSLYLHVSLIREVAGKHEPTPYVTIVPLIPPDLRIQHGRALHGYDLKRAFSEALEQMKRNLSGEELDRLARVEDVT